MHKRVLQFVRQCPHYLNLVQILKSKIHLVPFIERLPQFRFQLEEFIKKNETESTFGLDISSRESGLERQLTLIELKNGLQVFACSRA